MSRVSTWSFIHVRVVGRDDGGHAYRHDWTPYGSATLDDRDLYLRRDLGVTAAGNHDRDSWFSNARVQR